MKEFKIKQEGLEIKIEGNVFTVYPEDPDFLERIMNFKREALERKEKLTGRSGDDYIQDLRDTLKFLTDTIDAFLGAGSSAQIYSGKKVTLSSAIDIIAYIQDEASVNNKESMEKYTEYANRAQRRAKGNK